MNSINISHQLSLSIILIFHIHASLTLLKEAVDGAAHLGWAGGPPPFRGAGLVVPLGQRTDMRGQRLARGPAFRAVIGLASLEETVRGVWGVWQGAQEERSGISNQEKEHRRKWRDNKKQQKKEGPRRKERVKHVLGNKWLKNSTWGVKKTIGIICNGEGK